MTPPLRSATRVEGGGGRANDPAGGPTQRWTVEIALPVAQLAYNTTAAAVAAAARVHNHAQSAAAEDVGESSSPYAPAAGDFWRINFSRVEWRVAVSLDGSAYWKDQSRGAQPDNWVWSPQGEVAMHLPERWGMLQFASGRVNATPAAYNRQWTVRAVAAAVYYANRVG